MESKIRFAFSFLYSLGKLNWQQNTEGKEMAGVMKETDVNGFSGSSSEDEEWLGEFRVIKMLKE